MRIVAVFAALLCIAGIFLTKVEGTWPKVLGAVLILCLPVALVLLAVTTVQARRSGEKVTWGPPD